MIREYKVRSAADLRWLHHREAHVHRRLPVRRPGVRSMGHRRVGSWGAMGRLTHRWWFQWAIQLLWVVPVSFVVASSCYGVQKYPSATVESGHCYRAESRPGLAATAGLRYLEIPCP
jgi:hypothetical protein